jgi:hypothetical protein
MFSSFAHAQLNNPNKLPPCPKPDYSNKSDATKTAKWNKCFGKITIEFSQYSNGDVYEGEFNNGKLNGYGVHRTASGNIYSGMFKDGNWHGQGSLHSADGVKFTGNYKNNVRSGYGIEIKKDGYIEEGIWDGFDIVSSNTNDSSINHDRYESPPKDNDISSNILTNTKESDHIKIKPRFDWVGPFKEGLAAVRIGLNKYGFINKRGDIVINPQFDYALDFQEGVAAIAIKKNEKRKWGFVDKNGKLIIKPQFDFVFSFKEGLAVVQFGSWESGKYGYINMQGQIVINPQFDFASEFKDGLARVDIKEGNSRKSGLINKQGIYVINPQSDIWIAEFQNGIAAVKVGDDNTGKWGFINKQWKITITPQFDYANGFTEGLARIVVKDKKGFVDSNGEIVISPQYDQAESFSEGLAAVRIGSEENGKWGFIDKKGNLVIDIQFDDARSFKEGLAAVRIGNPENGKWGYVNKEGRYVINPFFDSNEKNFLDRSFSEGLASVCLRDNLTLKCGFISKEKNTKIRPEIDSQKNKNQIASRQSPSKFSIYAASNNPDSDGTIIITVRTNSDTSSLKVNDFEEGGKPDGKYTIKRVVRVNQSTSFNIIATDIFGNKAESTITVHRYPSTATATTDYAVLKPENIKRKSDRDAVAIIIGIADYKNLPKADFANDDARVFYDYALRALSIKPDNIKLLVDGDASEVGIYKAFKTWLPSKVKSSTDVYVFYSGHGLPTADGKGLYLLPQQTDRDLISKTAIQMQEVISDIQSTKPKSVTLFLDACYSGQSRTGETLIASARPLSIKSESRIFPENFTVITASQNDQISSSNPDLKHGIFSYYLMRGMEGDADTDKDGKITLGEMQSYLVENVGRQAGMMNRKQEPQLIGDANKVLVGR